tara:strand:- start:1091 stop:1306 length:216 start_codon:yes stop_codon:yes gene_type:complete
MDKKKLIKQVKSLDKQIKKMDLEISDLNAKYHRAYSPKSLIKIRKQIDKKILKKRDKQKLQDILRLALSYG